MSFHVVTEDGGIKAYRAFQIAHRNVAPHDLIRHLALLD
jgi:hypothetical protein